MNAIQRGRLMKLANHLLHGKLGHKKWDFSVLNDGGETYDKNGCGTAGCALGECPIVFPKHWKFKKQHGFFFVPVTRETTEMDAFSCAQSFFGIDDREASHLFDPTCQLTELYGGKYLSSSATRKQVARNILAFLKKKDKAK